MSTRCGHPVAAKAATQQEAIAASTGRAAIHRNTARIRSSLASDIISLVPERRDSCRLPQDHFRIVTRDSCIQSKRHRFQVSQ